jgi:cobalt/nickel transport system permease protein
MIPSFLLQKEQTNFENKAVKNKLSFVDKTIKNAATFITTSFSQYYTSHKTGLLQSIDPRVKVSFMLCFVVLINLTHAITAQLILFLIIFLLYILSKLKVIRAYKKIALIGFLFGFLIFVPASLNIFTNGQSLITLFSFSKEHQWWIYKIPKEITITLEGIYTVLRLTLKVVNSVSVVLLIISTTNFESVIKSFSFFKIPGIFLLTLTMSYKFIFVLSKTVEESYQALKMRWWSRGLVVEAEKIVAGRVGYLFQKSWERYELVYQSMIARGLNSSVNFNYFDRLKLNDYFFICTNILLIALIILINIFYG